MKLFCCGLLVAGLAYLPGALADSPPSLQDRLAPCLKCHQGKLALTGRDAEKLLESLRQIRAGKKPHPPGLKAFTEEELVEIANLLAGPKPE